MTATFVLVHSPLVGPVTWSWVAEELKKRGHPVALPSLKRAASSRRWQRCVDAVVSQAPAESVVLVGHSGAGPLLPEIATRMKAPPTRVIFVDATLPPASGGVPLVPEELLASLRALARNGRLPKWSEWFGPGTIEALVPDPGRRAVVLEDLPEIPLSYFDERIPVPAGWVNADGAYILLSDPYRSDAAEAASRGWPVRELPGSHLDIVTRASDVSDALVELTQP